MSPSTNHLLSRLLHMTPEASEHLERVTLMPGPWPTRDEVNVGGHVYFLESGLVGLFWPAEALAGVGMALLGCHDCWCDDGWNVSPLRANVLQAGHAQRIHSSVLQAQPQRYATWLLKTAEASQQLIHQIAQMAFCAVSHNTLQRMASCLLVVMNQNLQYQGQISVAELARWLACPEGQALAAAQTLQAQGAVVLERDGPEGVKLHSLQPQRLSGLACLCHLQVVPRQRSAGGVGV